MPYPLWTDPEIVYGTDLNTLTSQGIARFTSAAERASYIPSPAEGQVTYVTGRGFEEFKTGQWVQFSPGPRLLGGKEYPGTFFLVDSVAGTETYGQMETGALNLSGGKRYAVEGMVAVSSTVAYDTAYITVREDDGSTHLTGQQISYTLAPLTVANAVFTVPFKFEFTCTEDMARTYVLNAKRQAGTGLITVWRRDNTYETSVPRIQVSEIGQSSVIAVA